MKIGKRRNQNLVGWTPGLKNVSFENSTDGCLKGRNEVELFLKIFFVHPHTKFC
jgi:hypothetical protein